MPGAESSPARQWASRKPMTASGSSALWTMISVISIWRRKLCSPSTTRSGQKCHLCLKNNPVPMCPVRTTMKMVARDGLEPPTPAFSGLISPILLPFELTTYGDFRLENHPGSATNCNQQARCGFAHPYTSEKWLVISPRCPTDGLPYFLHSPYGKLFEIHQARGSSPRSDH